MGLEHARHTVVGTPMKKGISGGERKRLCVGIELLGDPKLLFLVLLKAGEIAYQGPAKDALAYFEQTGFPCPPLTNPADHILDSCVSLSRTDSSHSLVYLRCCLYCCSSAHKSNQHAYITPLIANTAASDMDVDNDLHLKFTRPHFDLNVGADKPKLTQRQTTSWFKQFSVILERTLKEQTRKKTELTTQLIQTVIMAFLIGLAFLNIGNTQKSIVKRGPVLFFCAVNMGMFGALTTINSFPGERMLALRERASGTYLASAYFFAKVTAETLVQLPLPLIFSCIVYYLIGLQRTPEKFLIFWAIMTLTSLAATSLALMISAFCRTTDLSVTVLPMALEVSRLFGGFFLSPKNLPAYFAWLDAVSYVKYAYIGAALNENAGLVLRCTAKELKFNSKGESICPVTSGAQVMADLGTDAWSVGRCCLALVLYIAIARFLAYEGIRYIKH
eukprot:15330-Heterococcus_DN1.PRE.2